MSLRVIEMFAGIGSQYEALKRLGVECEVVGWADWDKIPDKAYKILHNPKTENLWDITKIKSLPECDLMTYSFPCQSVSNAGKRMGLEKGSGTQSSMLWEVERLLEDYKQRGCLPKYLLMENVKGLVSKKFIGYFHKWLEVLENYGYNNYWKVLNAKDFNIPQNRERVFVVSIRKDLDDGMFSVSMGRPCRVRLSDVLEEEVDLKYYITQKAIDGIQNSKFNTERDRIQNIEKPSDCLSARDYKSPKCVPVEIDGCKELTSGVPQAQRIYDISGISVTQNANGGGMGGKGGLYAIEKVGETDKRQEPLIGRIVGRNPDNPTSRKSGEPLKQVLEISKKNICNCITTVTKDCVVVEPKENINLKKEYCDKLAATGKMKDYDIIRHSYTSNRLEGIDLMKSVSSNNIAPTLDTRADYLGVYRKNEKDYYVRKLTPRECMRLFGWTEDRIDTLLNASYIDKKGNEKKVMSDSAMYFLCGNSIVVNVLMAIFGQLLKVQNWKELVFKGYDDYNDQINMFDMVGDN